jgi:hypothetical protein
MKKVLILLLIGLFTFSLKAQQNQVNPDYLKNAKKKVRLGATFTILGGVAMVGGITTFIYENVTTDGREGWEKKQNIANIGLAVFCVGGIEFCTGLPFWIIGGIQKDRAKRNLKLSLVQFKTPNQSAPVNGFGLTVRF